MSEQLEEVTAPKPVDLCGEVCPMTFVRAKLHLDRAAASEVVRFLLKDDDQLRSVAISLKQEGHRIEAVEQEDGHYRIRVRKGPGNGRSISGLSHDI